MPCHSSVYSKLLLSCCSKHLPSVSHRRFPFLFSTFFFIFLSLHFSWFLYYPRNTHQVEKRVSICSYSNKGQKFRSLNCGSWLIKNKRVIFYNYFEVQKQKNIKIKKLKKIQKYTSTIETWQRLTIFRWLMQFFFCYHWKLPRCAKLEVFFTIYC